MALPKRQSRNKNDRDGLLTALVAVLVLATSLHLLGFSGTDCSMTIPSGSLLLSQHGNTTMPTTTASLSKIPQAAIQVTTTDQSCLQLPTIRPSGSVFFQNAKCKKAESHPDASPSFHFGTFFPNVKRIRYHMGGDLPHFQLIKEQFNARTSDVNPQQHKRQIGLDVGANQGFFTYFLAALGMEVHAFEINPSNFEALQHGTHFNPPEIANHVHLYAMGLSSTNERFGIQGGGYEGFLSNNKNRKTKDVGNILSVTMDCFFAHVSKQQQQQDSSTSSSLLFQNNKWNEISFLKIDVEGFEVNVLQGAKQSLANIQIGSLMMEVGPSRWSRSGATLDEGILEFQALSRKFANSHVIFRKEDSSCPVDKLKGALSSSSTLVRSFYKVHMYKVVFEDLKPLLEAMQANNADCNFWYTQS